MDFVKLSSEHDVGSESAAAVDDAGVRDQGAGSSFHGSVSPSETRVCVVKTQFQTNSYTWLSFSKYCLKLSSVVSDINIIKL